MVLMNSIDPESDSSPKPSQFIRRVAQMALTNTSSKFNTFSLEHSTVQIGSKASMEHERASIPHRDLLYSTFRHATKS